MDARTRSRRIFPQRRVATGGRHKGQDDEWLRSRVLAVMEAGRRHPLRVLLIAIAVEVSALSLIASVSDNPDVFSLPGSVAALTAVASGTLAGAAAGALTALAGGGLFFWLLSDLNDQSAPLVAALSVALWLAAGVISSMLAEALRERDAQRTETAVRLAEAEAARAAELEVSALHSALEDGLLPTAPQDDARLSIVTAYRPGERRLQLGGDFLDVLHLPDGGLALVIGDVMGHGPQAAALGVRLRAAWQGLTLAGADLTTVADSLNRLVLLSNQGLATACLARIDALAETALFLSAGHPRPLLITDRAATVELPSNISFGVLEDANYAGFAVTLPAQWALFFYTDGLIEGSRGGGRCRPHLEQRLRACLPSALPFTVSSVSRLVADMEGPSGGFDDDVAVIAVVGLERQSRRA